MYINLNQLKSRATQLVEATRFLPSNEEPERAGGYLTVGQILGDSFSMDSLLIGEISELEKFRRYPYNSVEKTLRLREEFVKDPYAAVSSWQTRDVEAGKYGGAVLFRRGENSALILSFSGLLEHCDESVDLSLGSGLLSVSDEQVRSVLEISKNNIYGELTHYLASL